jgi:hypothetical protein
MLGRWFWWPMNVYSRAARVDDHVGNEDTAEIAVPAGAANGHANGNGHTHHAANGHSTAHLYHR